MGPTMRTVLSSSGGDRATGYTMNNKIVSLPEGVLCTWLDSERQNRWALVDRAAAEILKEGTIGAQGRDNHCGAALVRSGETLHAMIGGHHGPLEHHTLDADDWTWRMTGVAGEAATYPSATADRDGRLHVFYRCGSKEHWSLSYVRLEEGDWSAPVALVHAHKTGYVYWTNGATTASDGTIHLVFGNPIVGEDGAIHYGASHLQSKDGGRSWEGSDGRVLGESDIAAESIPFLEAARSLDRIQPVEEQARLEAPGPENYNYQNMNLSNPVADAEGGLHVVLHNNMTGTAGLCSLASGVWSSRSLTEFVVQEEGQRVHPQSALSIGPDGTLYASLMIESADRCVWGPDGTFTQMLVIKDRITTVNITSADSEVAQWLPAMEHPPVDGLADVPGLMYTKGRNAGGFGNNQNALETDVVLVVEGE